MGAYVPPEKATGIRKQVYDRDGNSCVECGTRHRLTLDHKIPKSKGGKRTLENLQTMCVDCNCRKGSRLPGETSRPFPRAVPLGQIHPRVRALVS